MDFYKDILRTDEFRKLSGAHFTPENIVEEMCSTALNLLDTKKCPSILDLAAGTGVFAYYFIGMLSAKYGMPLDEAANLVTLVEKDTTFVIEARNIFSNLSIHPTILESDALFTKKLLKNTYDIVIGNPPYIRLQNLDDSYRPLLKNNYTVCANGATDIYYAFIQRALELVKPGGVVALITPSSYLRSKAGRNLRNNITNYVFYVKDHGSTKQFSCGAYTAILYMVKNKDLFSIDKTFTYNLYGNDYAIDRNMFVDNGIVIQNTKNAVLGDVCKITGGIATLRDNIFVLKPDKVDNTYIYVDNFKIEKTAVKKLVKLSLVKTEADIINTEYQIIFPYLPDLTCLDENKFATRFPETYKYLLYHKEELLKRDKGKSKGYKWFEFGRKQGLRNFGGRCIVTSALNDKPNFILTSELDNSLVRSGLVLSEFTVDAELLLNKLNSTDMYEYMKYNGQVYAGDWRGYTATTLKKFPIDL